MAASAVLKGGGRLAGLLAKSRGAANQGLSKGRSAAQRLRSGSQSFAKNRPLTTVGLGGLAASNALGGVGNTANQERDAMRNDNLGMEALALQEMLRAKYERMQLDNMAAIRQLDPHLFKEMTLGQQLAPGDIYIGPDPNNMSTTQRSTLAMLTDTF